MNALMVAMLEAAQERKGGHSSVARKWGSVPISPSIQVSSTSSSRSRARDSRAFRARCAPARDRASGTRPAARPPCAPPRCTSTPSSSTAFATARAIVNDSRRRACRSRRRAAPLRTLTRFPASANVSRSLPVFGIASVTSMKRSSDFARIAMRSVTGCSRARRRRSARTSSPRRRARRRPRPARACRAATSR